MLYVVGGVGPDGLARRAFALDLKTGRWASIPGPTPREHLAVTTAAGRVYAVAGRLAGIDTNLRAFEWYSPVTRRWAKLAPVPGARGGTGAAFAKGLIVSVGGEAPQGTIGSVFGYNVATKRWRRLADLPTPRHGVGVATIAGRVYVIGGGTEPGLNVSGANEALTLP
jgi:N-acetylneuraminic acid mutarotase